MNISLLQCVIYKAAKIYLFILQINKFQTYCDRVKNKYSTLVLIFQLVIKKKTCTFSAQMTQFPKNKAEYHCLVI